MTLYMRDQENIEKGRAEGRAEGHIEGRETQLKDSICRMITTKRFTNQEIADFLGTSLEMVNSVGKELVI